VREAQNSRSDALSKTRKRIEIPQETTMVPVFFLSKVRVLQ
jgi:hypothetical protein